MTQFTRQMIRKRCDVLFGIHDGSSYTKFSRCLSVSRWIFQRIQKELDKLIGDYVSTAVRNPRWLSWEKIIREILGGIKAIIENDSWESIWAVNKNIGFSDFC